LLEQERLVVDEPVAQRSSLLWLEVMAQALERFKGMQQIQFLPLHGPFEPTQPVERLRAQAFREHHLPAQAPGLDLRSREQLLHSTSPLP
jgi:hypothetical protein